MRKIFFAAAITGFLAACGSHDMESGEHGAMDHGAHSAATDTADLTPAQIAFAEVNTRMHEGMAIIPEDADLAFMQGMLAHHIGAVEMAEVALEHGKDEQVRDLAQRIIDAQAVEIAEMQAWLENREAAQATP